ncbi:MAG: RNA-binding protein [Chloroflexi bacterium]|nr:MAG: RNA-binding protein [Chloroflexota bacterium]
MRIYVGNLSYDSTEEELQKEFLAYGEMVSASILNDKFSGQPKGFGFVEMASKSEVEAAITDLNGKVLRKRTIVVNEARPRSGNRDGGFHDNRRGDGYGGGYGGERGGRQKRY